MDTYKIKSKLLELVALADTALQPQADHVTGNWHIQTWEKNFPYATVRIKMKNIPIYGFKPPTVAHGECYAYDFSVFVFAENMSASRDIMDNIMDYLAIHNKQSDAGIIDIINLQTQESVPAKGSPKRMWRMVLNGQIITEETIDSELTRKSFNLDFKMLKKNELESSSFDALFVTSALTPIIIDDDWAEWVVLDGDAVNFSLSDDSIIQKHGSNCLKAEATGDNAIIDFEHDYSSSPLDLSSSTSISFWFYGIGNNDEWYFYFGDGLGNSAFGYFNDTTVGWRLVTIRISDFNTAGEPFPPFRWGNITFIELWNNEGNGHIPSGTTYYFDYLIVS